MKASSFTLMVALLGAGSGSYVIAADPANSSPTESTPPGAEAGKVDLNTADAAALEQIPEIGTNFANAVMSGRPYKSVEDVDRVLKIGPEKINELKRKVTVSVVKPTAPTPPGDNPAATASKPPAFNDGKALNPKEVGERYDQKSGRQKPATERKEGK
jgi:hypothetical protein